MTAGVVDKKKGRPRKMRKGRPPRPLSREAEPGRTLRHRQRRPLVDDFDDYFEEDEEEEEPERKMRKLKLVLKLPHVPPVRKDEGEEDRCFDSPPAVRRASSYVDDEEPEQEMKPPKKRLIDDFDGPSGDRESGTKNVRRRAIGSVSGVTGYSLSGTPLPERKLLEVILDKLQKKDTYGVFAEPVDPEELPDYHDVIDHPMDFGTVRKKLSGNAYRSFEQFEDDIFLICSNAMQYNAPDTIYFRQAYTIQEMGRREFQKLRSENKCTVTEWKSEEIVNRNSIEKKQMRKSLSKTAEDPLGSEISSAPTLASAAEAGTTMTITQTNCEELPVTATGLAVADGSSSLGESKSEKGDELSVSAKGSPYRHGKKLSMVDESRRLTYNIVDQQPMIGSDSVFDVLENEQRQLVAVGLHAEYSYARSLASFAATVGPIAWKIVSQRIESALPEGIKFGPGWVGEFEPLPVPVLSLEKSTQHQVNSNSNSQFRVALEKNTETEWVRKARRHDDLNGARANLHSEVAEICGKATALMEGNYLGRATELKPGIYNGTADSQLRITSAMTQQRKEQMCFNLPSNALDEVQTCPSFSLSYIPVDQNSQKSKSYPEVTTSRSPKKISCDRKFPKQEPLEHVEEMTTHTMNHISKSDASDLNSRMVLGNSESNRLNNNTGFISKHQSGLVENCSYSGSCDQGFNDPSRSMSFSSKLLSQPKPNKVTDSLKLSSSTSPTSRENPGTAAVTPAWISVGTTRQYKPSVDGTALCKDQDGATTTFSTSVWRGPDYSSIFDDSKKIFNSQVSKQPIKVFNEEPRVHNKGMFIFSQLVPTDLSGYQGQIPWRGLVTSNQQKNNKTMCPPDLNISFHPPGSPVRSSAGILKDSQQPDLALQL